MEQTLVALWDFNGDESKKQLTFVEGNLIKTIPGSAPAGWSKGEVIQTGLIGYFPLNYTEPHVPPPFTSEDDSNINNNNNPTPELTPDTSSTLDSETPSNQQQSHSQQISSDSNESNSVNHHNNNNNNSESNPSSPNLLDPNELQLPALGSLDDDSLLNSLPPPPPPPPESESTPTPDPAPVPVLNTARPEPTRNVAMISNNNRPTPPTRQNTPSTSTSTATRPGSNPVSPPNAGFRRAPPPVGSGGVVRPGPRSGSNASAPNPAVTQPGRINGPGGLGRPSANTSNNNGPAAGGMNNNSGGVNRGASGGAAGNTGPGFRGNVRSGGAGVGAAAPNNNNSVVRPNSNLNPPSPNLHTNSNPTSPNPSDKHPQHPHPQPAQQQPSPQIQSPNAAQSPTQPLSPSQPAANNNNNNTKDNNNKESGAPPNKINVNPNAAKTASVLAALGKSSGNVAALSPRGPPPTNPDFPSNHSSSSDPELSPTVSNPISDDKNIEKKEQIPPSTTESSNSNSNGIEVKQQEEEQQQQQEEDVVEGYAKALYDYEGNNAHKNILSLSAGDVIEILQKNQNGWWTARSGNIIGYIPMNFIEEISKEEAAPFVVKPCKENMSSPSIASPTVSTTATNTGFNEVEHEKENKKEDKKEETGKEETRNVNNSSTGSGNSHTNEGKGGERSGSVEKEGEEGKKKKFGGKSLSKFKSRVVNQVKKGGEEKK